MTIKRAIKKTIAKIYLSPIRAASWLADQITIEKMVVVAVIQGEQYVCLQRFRRFFLQRRKERASNILFSIGATLPIECDLQPSRGCETVPRTCFVFWITDEASISNFNGRFIRFCDYREHLPRAKVEALEKAFRRVNPDLLALS